MNKLATSVRAQALHMLVEGSSMSAVSRILGINISTVSKLLADAGEACIDFHDTAVQNVQARYVQCDETWSFCYAKARNAESAQGVIDYAGDVYTWIGIEADTKLVISWLPGDRGTPFAVEFMRDLKSRLANRIQLSTDGLGAYIHAVDQAFGGDVDYLQLGRENGARVGNPNDGEINRSYIERQNLTIRMALKRCVRQTNAFSKRFRNHNYALALYFVWYNFMRTHMSIGTTPAIAAGITDRTYNMHHLIELIDERAPAPRRGPYRKRR